VRICKSLHDNATEPNKLKPCRGIVSEVEIAELILKEQIATTSSDLHNLPVASTPQQSNIGSIITILVASLDDIANGKGHSSR
jgi:hypothetical protein